MCASPTLEGDFSFPGLFDCSQTGFLGFVFGVVECVVMVGVVVVSWHSLPRDVVVQREAGRRYWVTMGWKHAGRVGCDGCMDRRQELLRGQRCEACAYIVGIASNGDDDDNDIDNPAYSASHGKHKK